MAAAGLVQRRCNHTATYSLSSTAAPAPWEPHPFLPHWWDPCFIKYTPRAFLWASVYSGAQVCPYLSSLLSKLSFAPEPNFCFTCLGDTAQKDPRRGPTGKVGDISLSSPTTGERIKESLNGDYMSITKNGNLKSSYRKFITFSTHLTLWTKFMHTSTLSQTGECACVISCCYFISDFFRVDSLSVTSINETSSANSGLCLLCLLKQKSLSS